MYNDEDLQAAIAAGIFSEEAVAAFREQVAERQHTTLADEEHFRLISGFNDIFVVLAGTLLLFSLGWLGAQLHAVLGLIGVAAGSWGIAEVFVRQRRMALPAIVSLASFVGSCGMVGISLSGEMNAATIPLSGSLGLAAAAAHWRRFHVPITVAAAVATLLVTLFGMLLQIFPALQVHPEGLFLLGGLLCFATAMHWDMADPARQTRKTDIAFWLHLLAAPLIVHPVFSLLGIEDGSASFGGTLLVLTLYALFAALSLAVDRRALMVSAMAYVLYAISNLLEANGMLGEGMAVAGVVLGTSLLLLSAFWHRCRSLLLQHLPTPWRARLPALHTAPRH